MVALSVTCSDGGQTYVFRASLLWFVRVVLHQAESCQHTEEGIVSTLTMVQYITKLHTDI